MLDATVANLLTGRARAVGIEFDQSAGFGPDDSAVAIVR
jgi:hypothetical protein